jgi:hypothetical protein
MRALAARIAETSEHGARSDGVTEEDRDAASVSGTLTTRAGDGI